MTRTFIYKKRALDLPEAQGVAHGQFLRGRGRLEGEGVAALQHSTFIRGPVGCLDQQLVAVVVPGEEKWAEVEHTL